MNYLAHILLSGKDDKVKVGNFIGDFVKGNAYDNYDKDIKKGILLHRFIDDYTDKHPKVKQDVKRLSDKIGRYAPIAVDVFYDHLIAQNWENFNATTSITNFCKDFYQTVEIYRTLIPEKCKHVFYYMRRDNWLENYQHEQGISWALSGLSKRTKFASRLDESLPLLLDDKEEILDDFIPFFNELNEESKTFLNGQN